MRRVDVPKNITSEWLVEQMRKKDVGTEGALDSLFGSLEGAESLPELEAVLIAFIVRLTRTLECRRVDGTNILSRGKIVGIALSALAEVRGRPETEVTDTCFNCPECHGECGVVKLCASEGVTTLRCRKCNHEFSRKI